MDQQAAPRVRGNDWGVLDAPEPEAHEPTLSVTVVVPAHRAGSTLPYTLAALAAQTYPAHLLEVVVVDDQEDGEPLTLPELRPDRVRLVPAEGSWGRAHACRVGAAVAEGDVIHWLDADMVPARDQVARQLRWHHTLDHAVVLGHKLFVDDTDLPPVSEVHTAMSEGDLAELLAGRVVGEHEWVERIWRRTDDLRGAGLRAFHVHVGSTASLRQQLYVDAGGMDPAMKLGEDVELGYRLALKGAVFVADRTATSWHLGRSQLMRHQQRVQRYNGPFIAQRVPDFRKFRQETGRSYRVPFVDVVVEVADRGFEEVRYTVDGVLAGRPQDIRCRLVGPWSQLHDGRREPLWDAELDLRLLREEYSPDPRVELVEKLEQTAFPAPYRLLLPTGWRPGADTLEHMTRAMQRSSGGLRTALLPDGQVVRLERTAAFERARRVAGEGEDLDAVVDAVSETWWVDGLEAGFERHDPDGSPPDPRAAGPAERSPAPDRSTAPRTVVRRALSAIRGRTRKE